MRTAAALRCLRQGVGSSALSAASSSYSGSAVSGFASSPARKQIHDRPLHCALRWCTSGAGAGAGAEESPLELDDVLDMLLDPQRQVESIPADSVAQCLAQLPGPEAAGAKAQYCQGILLWEGIGCTQDRDAALSYLRVAAEAAFTPACGVVGYILYSEPQSPEEKSEGRGLIEKAAREGFAPAQHNLAVILDGEDNDEKLVWWRMAAENGHPEASNFMGLNSKSDEDAFAWFHKGAELGSSSAMNNVAHCFHHGVGTEQSIPEATSWYQRGATAGNVHARYNLGYILMESAPKESVVHFHAAAKEGYTEAQAVLGLCYQQGRGTECDINKALEWWRCAADNGHTSAQFNVGLCLLQGAAADPEPVAAVEWLRKAAAANHPDATGLLASCYFNGNGVTQDRDEGFRLLKKAAELGCADAKKLLSEVQ
eukprot:TRINITY_DN33390_c0_g2_i1.p1 TRINITY_DN33390_c0_g2~~TRINITY_DN33390_c0_g2_i1.p1  ORF type:complete len:427 (+),score=119.28 TRINITY_DN33390_c0_g2_i1:124-1404(+)